MEKTVWFSNFKGYRLSGTILVPDGTPPYPAVIFSHGLYSGKFSPRNLQIARELLKNGIAALLIDFTGHGDSEGTIEESSIDQQVDDLGSAVDFLAGRDDVDAQRLGVNGSSTGGTVAVIRAAGDPRIKALVLRSPRADGAIKAAYLVSAPTLIIAGQRDTVVVEECNALYAALSGEKRLEMVKGAGHLFEQPEQLRQATELTIGWFQEKLGKRVARAA
ncbi:MAG: alpha/beta hydrolase [Chloroflexi bacterium]|nr:alpha/beta hydrolase [Chloroflexota bacterium]